MGRFVRVAKAGEVEEGRGRVVQVEGRVLAVFRVKDQYFAVGNVCLHRGGPLAEGELQGHVVTCPWHGWQFDVRTGSFTVIPTLKVKTYNVKLEGGRYWSRSEKLVWEPLRRRYPVLFAK